jgi:predicted Zn-dependent protease
MRLFCICSALAAAILACGVSTDEERELGAEYAAHADSQLPLLEDTVVTSFVTRLGESLATRTSRADLGWRFTVVNSSTVNAFALPGGFIYVTRGLMENSEQLEELAGVMAHEVGHVELRHPTKQMEKSAHRDVALFMLCTLTNACATPGRAIAVQVAADAASAQYSQGEETQADSEAVDITYRAGFDPAGLPAFLRRLLARSAEQPTPIEAFFSSHPTDEARVAALNRRIAAAVPSGARDLIRDTPEFQAIREHLRQLPPPPVISGQQ